MLFYSNIKGTNLVWNKDKDVLLCTFRNGVFETFDEFIIEHLIEIGYKHDKKVKSVKSKKKIEKFEEFEE